MSSLWDHMAVLNEVDVFEDISIIRWKIMVDVIYDDVIKYYVF